MMKLKCIEIEIKDKLVTVWLNQPEKRNALNLHLIEEIIKVFRWIEKQKELMIVVIRGRGKSFCAGADINWMLDSGKSGYKNSLRDSRKLAKCFNQIYLSSKVVINLVHGDISGGGLGFAGAADFTFAEKKSVFRLPELQLGLIPSVIMPYLLTRVNQRDLKYLTFSVEKFSAEEALQKGFIDKVCVDVDDMEIKANELIRKILPVSQPALSETKELLRVLNSNLVNPGNIRKTIKTITKLKMSDDAGERMAEFFSRKPGNAKNNK
jgi:methylglutaconyl-CoA hydratase